MQEIHNMAGVGIIASEADPQKVFLEMKTGSLTILPFRWTFCPFGGNWRGEVALHDGSPLGTFRREIREELGLRPMKRDWNDLEGIGLAGDTPDSGESITADDWEKLEYLKQEISDRAEPWRDYLVPTSARVMNMVPGTKPRPSILTLVSYHQVLLPDDVWSVLEELQGKFETISVENESAIITLDEIVVMERRFAYNHESALVDFWKEMGFEELADRIRRFPHDPVTYIGSQRRSYEEYLKDFAPKVRP